MLGFSVLIGSFILAGVVRVILKKLDECMMASFLPQLIMLVGGIIGAYLFLQDNWSGLGVS